MKRTKNLIYLSYKLRGRKDFDLYNDFRNNGHKSLEELEIEQLEAFHKLFQYSKRNVPYYRELFTKLKLEKEDFKKLEDLDKIPILTKQIIKDNYDSFFSENFSGKHIVGATGGSTGEPLKYRMSVEDNSRSFALLYRGLGYGGYELGDKMAVIAGGSLVKNQQSLTTKINNVILNFKKFSSYGMSQEDLENIYLELHKWSPGFLRGYANSLALFANYCAKNNKKLNFDAVFSTAEMLSLKQRSLIEETFGCKVFNNYGLNDGGVSAYESKDQNGFIIDTERGILETVPDNSQKNQLNVEGRIIATSLYNYAFPFIRYDTGDLGVQNYDKSLERKKLTSLLGRKTDYLEINGKSIGSPVLTILMGTTDVIKYQIIQKRDDSLELRILKGEKYDISQEKFIRDSLKSNLGEAVKIEIIYTKDFIQSKNKHKFIFRE
ncbi:hypothetical protein [uncultured Aquimarina sp.]|uniref:hypothetical protein n=1 Tax=uncultured Aquimarina sp. TaxID=575652 RepID=UPI00261B7AEF|nr:hypothetical protein [uncultured Aquimarina sp.]